MPAVLEQARKLTIANTSSIERHGRELVEEILNAELESREVATDPQLIADLLDALDWSHDDLLAKVDILKRRRSAVVRLGELPGILKRQREVEAAIATAEQKYGAALKRLQADHFAKMQTLRDEVATLGTREAQSRAAEDFLRSTFNDPQLLREERELAADTIDLALKLRACDEELREGAYDESGSPVLAHQAARARNRANDTAGESPESIRKYRAEADSLARQVAAKRRERDGIKNELDKINRRLTEISLAKLIP